MKVLTDCRFILRTYGHAGPNGERRKRLIVTGLKENGIRVKTAECVCMIGQELRTRNGKSWWIVGDISA